jgi:hypothetical protein
VVEQLEVGVLGNRGTVHVDKAVTMGRYNLPETKEAEYCMEEYMNTLSNRISTRGGGAQGGMARNTKIERNKMLRQRS